MTGEEADLYRVVDVSRRPCLLDGYPEVMLLDSTGRPLPFHYTHAGTQYLPHRAPAPVLLEPHGEPAYIKVAKYRCDRGDARLVATVRVRPGGQQHGGRGSSSLGYCKGGARDPGQLVAVSAFVARPPAQ